MTDTDNRSETQAQAQLESIREMVNALKTEDDNALEEAQQAIQEDALSVVVRSGWHTPGDTGRTSDYMILLCWGGPAVRIIGELNEYSEPETCRIEHQDWGTPWTEYGPGHDDEDVLTYARQFYFGE